ncbi:hypothetical protein [Malacoplasma iowae]|uniref:hypothetical protein n=1 Tax=Malacoplasma iowae TaxID=2116 RepID=UPI0038738C95|nr:hypothetical protein QX179_00740 [Malacoplasma iowae]
MLPGKKANKLKSEINTDKMKTKENFVIKICHLSIGFDTIINSTPSFSQSLKILIDLEIKNVIENKVAIIDDDINILSDTYAKENKGLFFSSLESEEYII